MAYGRCESASVAVLWHRVSRHAHPRTETSLDSVALEQILELGGKKRELVGAVLSEDIGGAKKLTKTDLEDLSLPLVDPLPELLPAPLLLPLVEPLPDAAPLLAAPDEPLLSASDSASEPEPMSAVVPPHAARNVSTITAPLTRIWVTLVRIAGT